MAAAWRSTGNTPAEQIYKHQAGWGGVDSSQASSYIDSVIFRDRDMTNGGSAVTFGQAGDGTLEDRVYYLQNWRADVSVIANAYGEQVESVKYASYGTPFCVPAGDVDLSGSNSGDYNTIQIMVNNSRYSSGADMNADGVLDATDVSLAQGLDGTSAGRGVASTSACEVAAYEAEIDC